jgi:hypothetical protein
LHYTGRASLRRRAPRDLAGLTEGVVRPPALE